MTLAGGLFAYGSCDVTIAAWAYVAGQRRRRVCSLRSAC
jgi:hypothetical protein